MLDEITKNIKDESLCEWFLPGFSTTTEKDKVCASAAAMCTLQKYFSYKFFLVGGIPSVTLLGTVEDWQKLRDKEMDRLAEFDTDERLIQRKWLPMLQYVGDNLVESAKNGSKNNLHFWDTIASKHGGGSGPTYLSGWITAFTYFDDKGKPIRNDPNTKGLSGLDLNLCPNSASVWDATVFCRLIGTPSWPEIDIEDINSNIILCVSCPNK